MIENRMVVDSEWEAVERQWVEPEEVEFRVRKPRRKLKLKRRIYNEEERKEHGENDIIPID